MCVPIPVIDVLRLCIQHDYGKDIVRVPHSVLEHGIASATPTESTNRQTEITLSYPHSNLDIVLPVQIFLLHLVALLLYDSQISVV